MCMFRLAVLYKLAQKLFMILTEESIPYKKVKCQLHTAVFPEYQTLGDLKFDKYVSGKLLDHYCNLEQVLSDCMRVRELL
jgi:hypothetical protein